MKKIKSIEDIINDYDNFIIDQWGVMHDGTLGYEPVSYTHLTLPTNLCV